MTDRPFHKWDRISTAVGGATLTGFSKTIKGEMVDAPEAPRRKRGHLPYAHFITDSGRFGATQYHGLRPEVLPSYQLCAGDLVRHDSDDSEPFILESVATVDHRVHLRWIGPDGLRVTLSNPAEAKMIRIRTARHARD